MKRTKSAAHISKTQHLYTQPKTDGLTSLVTWYMPFISYIQKSESYIDCQNFLVTKAGMHSSARRVAGILPQTFKHQPGNVAVKFA